MGAAKKEKAEKKSKKTSTQEKRKQAAKELYDNAVKNKAAAEKEKHRATKKANENK